MKPPPPQAGAEDSHEHSEATADLTLIHQLQYGCAQCFSLIFYKYCQIVFRIAWRVLRDRGAAEDVVQEVFLDIYLRNDRYDAARGSVKTWIFQSAYFKALGNRRRLRIRSTDSLDQLDLGRQALWSQSHRSEELRDAVWIIDKELPLLNERQRRAIELIHFDGYTLMETANILQESLANTRNLYYRGLKALRSSINSQSSRSHSRNFLATGGNLLDTQQAYDFEKKMAAEP